MTKIQIDSHEIARVTRLLVEEAGWPLNAVTAQLCCDIAPKLAKYAYIKGLEHAATLAAPFGNQIRKHINECSNLP